MTVLLESNADADRRVRLPKWKWKICDDAVAEMRGILDELERYPDVCEECAALRKQLGRIDRVCQQLASAPAGDPEPAPEPAPPAGEEREPAPLTAKELVDRIPLNEIFEDKALADEFLSEFLLAVARASTRESRHRLQQEGIEAAKARGVQMGRRRRALPPKFEEACERYRSGLFTAKEAANYCGMPRTTFRTAVRRREEMASSQ